MVSEGLITLQDIEDAKSSDGNTVISIGLPAYCLLRSLLRSGKANSGGILLSKTDFFPFTLSSSKVFFLYFIPSCY